MIEIRIEGQLLYIAKKTSLQLEVNNSAFTVNKIEGDIVFTFDVPAAQNDLVFGQARFVYVQKHKKYECAVCVGGVEIAHGDLYIQKSTATTYSCGLVINPFPSGFAERKLSQNDYGAHYIISNSTDGLKTGWLNMLAKSLKQDSFFKFPLFINTAFYGSVNKDFGWFLLPNDVAPEAQSGFQASINTNDNVGLDRCYINRLFTYDMKNAIEALADNRGIRVFNNKAVDNPNSFAFAPAIQLLWILENVIKNAGYQMIGNFAKEDCIKKIFSQSLRALDGLDAQTEVTGSAKAAATFSPSGAFEDEQIDYYELPFEVNGMQHRMFRAQKTQEHQITMNIKTYLPANLLAASHDNGYTRTDEGVLFIFLNNAAAFPDIFKNKGNWNEKIGYSPNGYFSALDCFYKAYTMEQLKSQIGYNGAGYYDFNFSFSQPLNSGNYYFFSFVKIKVLSDLLYAQIALIDDMENIPIIGESETVYKVCNVFSNKIKFGEHVPALSNSDFISTICNAFGLNMYIDSAKGQIELTFFKDILTHAQAVDLSP
jgi:hypothetical protein